MVFSVRDVFFLLPVLATGVYYRTLLRLSIVSCKSFFFFFGTLHAWEDNQKQNQPPQQLPLLPPSPPQSQACSPRATPPERPE